jgi:hypothetical protein
MARSRRKQAMGNEGSRVEKPAERAEASCSRAGPRHGRRGQGILVQGSLGAKNVTVGRSRDANATPRRAAMWASATGSVAAVRRYRAFTSPRQRERQPQAAHLARPAATA